MFADNLAFSLNATIPVFLMMVFGWSAKRIGLLDDHTTSKLNKFVFTALLPALLFMDLYTVCDFLHNCNDSEHINCSELLASPQGQDGEGRNSAGLVPEQCGDTRNSFCEEYLR